MSVTSTSSKLRWLRSMPLRLTSIAWKQRLMNYISFYGKCTMNIPRGIRNNNPGNIRWGSDWKGLKKDGKQQDPSFCVFETPEYGIRTLSKLLRNYQQLYGLNTPRKIISRYAPPTENETVSYIDSVSRQLNITPDTPIDLSEDGVLLVFIKAIIRHENGIQPYSNETLLKGIQMA